MEQIHEIRVEEYDQPSRIINLVKEFLLKNEQVNIVSGTNSSPNGSRAAESLVRFGYVTIENVQTLTEVRNNRRNIRLIITVKKTNDFQKIYDQNKEEVKNHISQYLLQSATFQLTSVDVIGIEKYSGRDYFVEKMN